MDLNFTDVFLIISLGKVRSNTCYSAPLQASPTAESLRYMARTKQRRTYLPYTFPAV